MASSWRRMDFMVYDVVDAWAQPVFSRARQDLPEVVRLLEKPGSAGRRTCQPAIPRTLRGGFFSRAATRAFGLSAAPSAEAS